MGGCAQKHKPGVYARISNQYQWIKSIMDEWNCESDDNCVNGSECDVATCEDGLCKYNPDDSKSIEVKITIKTDMFPQETHWTVTSADSSKTLLYGGGYTMEEHTYDRLQQLCFGNYLFNIEDTYGDGICCSEGRGFYEIYVGEDKVLSGDGKFGKKESQAFEISEEWTTITYDTFEDEEGNFKGGLKRTNKSRFALNGQFSYKKKHDISKFDTLRISFIYKAKLMNDDEFTVNLNKINDFPFITDLEIRFLLNKKSKKNKKKSSFIVIDDVKVEGQ